MLTDRAARGAVGQHPGEREQGRAPVLHHRARRHALLRRRHQRRQHLHVQRELPGRLVPELRRVLPPHESHPQERLTGLHGRAVPDRLQLGERIELHGLECVRLPVVRLQPRGVVSRQARVHQFLAVRSGHRYDLVVPRRRHVQHQPGRARPAGQLVGQPRLVLVHPVSPLSVSWLWAINSCDTRRWHAAGNRRAASLDVARGLKMKNRPLAPTAAGIGSPEPRNREGTITAPA